MQMKQTQKCQRVASACWNPSGSRGWVRSGVRMVVKHTEVSLSLQKVLPPAAPYSASTSRNSATNESSCPSQAVPGHWSQTGQLYWGAHANVQTVPELNKVRLNQSRDRPPYTWDYLCPGISKLEHHFMWNKFCFFFVALTRKSKQATHRNQASPLQSWCIQASLSQLSNRIRATAEMDSADQWDQMVKIIILGN